MDVDARMGGGEPAEKAGLVEQPGGELDEAETLCREVIAFRRKALGEVHPQVAIALHNLTTILADDGRIAVPGRLDYAIAERPPPWQCTTTGLPTQRQACWKRSFARPGTPLAANAAKRAEDSSCPSKLNAPSGDAPPPAAPSRSRSTFSRVRWRWWSTSSMASRST